MYEIAAAFWEVSGLFVYVCVRVYVCVYMYIHMHMCWVCMKEYIYIIAYIYIYISNFSVMYLKISIDFLAELIFSFLFFNDCPKDC